MILSISYCPQGPSDSHLMTSEQIESDLANAPDNDIVFITRPPGVENANESGTCRKGFDRLTF